MRDNCIYLNYLIILYVVICKPMVVTIRYQTQIILLAYSSLVINNIDNERWQTLRNMRLLEIALQINIHYAYLFTKQAHYSCMANQLITWVHYSKRAIVFALIPSTPYPVSQKYWIADKQWRTFFPFGNFNWKWLA